jgi:hypothetical protein
MSGFIVEGMFAEFQSQPNDRCDPDPGFQRNIENFGFGGRDPSRIGGEDPSLPPRNIEISRLSSEMAITVHATARPKTTPRTVSPDIRRRPVHRHRH